MLSNPALKRDLPIPSTIGYSVSESHSPYNKISDQTLEKIRAYKEWMQQKRYSASTVKTYVSFVKRFFGNYSDLEWNEVTKQHIIDYNHAYFIEQKLSYSAQNQWLNAIKLFTQVVGNETGLVQEDIQRPRKQKYLPDVLSQNEVRDILDHTKNLKQRTLLMVIYSTGMRIGEVLDLKLADIKSDESLIYLRQGKGGKDRRLPLSDTLLQKLRNYYRAYKPITYLFEGSSAGKPYSRVSASKFLKRSVKSCGIKKRITLHTIRHSYATHLTQKGINIQYLQEILGHKSPKTTMIYTHLSGNDLKKLPDPLDDIEI